MQSSPECFEGSTRVGRFSEVDSLTFRFRILGTVLADDNEQPLPNLEVRAFDRDVVFDDPLGSARTDERGEFEIHFTEAAFRDAVETRPDLYLRVFDARGDLELENTRPHVRRNARVEERFTLRIPRERLTPG